jgi:hypothetical protein
MSVDGSYDASDVPSLTSPSSIILFIIPSISIILSFFVVFSITFLLPSSTTSSKLVRLLHLSILIGTIFKLPFVFSGHIICQCSGFVINYVGCQVILITFYLFHETNIFQIVKNQEVSVRNKLSLKSLAILTLVPFVVGIISITFASYHRHGPWCQINSSTVSSSYVILTVYVFLWLIQLLLFSNLFYLIYLLSSLPTHLIFETLTNILSGPISFALYTSLIYLSLDLVVLSSIFSSSEKSLEEYYLDYSFSILQYLLGLGYALIYFLLEQKNLKRIEENWNELNLFNQIFFGSFSEAAGGTGDEVIPRFSEGSSMSMNKLYEGRGSLVVPTTHPSLTSFQQSSPVSDSMITNPITVTPPSREVSTLGI